MCKILKSAIVQLRMILDNIIDFFFGLYWDGKKANVPDLEVNKTFLEESAVSLARKIRQKEITSEELVRAVIQRIKEVNPIINAVIEERYKAALEEAKEIDNLIALGLSEDVIKKKPFLGVPFTTKESHAIKGFHYTMGLRSRRELRADEDSESVVRLKEAGAILLAATNLPELLIWQETRNMVYGQTNNPHHTGRSPGGSTGAEAALQACCSAVISLGSDLGGSTRMPAFYCGMFGYLATAGVTSTKGVFFRKGNEAESMLSLGFISRHAEDFAPLVNALAGEKAHLLKLDRKVDIKDLKFYYVETSDDCLVSPIRSDLRNAMTRVIKKISQEVKTISTGPEPYQHEGLNHMYKLWSYKMTKEPDNYASLYNNRGDEAKAWIELPKKLLGLSGHCMSSVVRLTELQCLPAVRERWAETLYNDLKNDLLTKLGDNGILLFPSAPHAAPYHYSCFLRPYNFSYWALINALKCPATQVPLGVNDQGLPLGIQVVAAPYNDLLCIRVAEYLEQAFGGAVISCSIRK